MGNLRGLDFEVRGVFDVADDVGVVELALLVVGVLLGFFGCMLLLLALLLSRLVLGERACEVYLSSFALLRNWLATGLQQMDGPALVLCTNKKECL